MKKIYIIFLIFLIIPLPQLLFPQEQPKKEEEIKSKRFFYSPAGRRDPFRDLLTGRVVPEKPKKSGRAGLSVEEITLAGITKVKGEYTAIVNAPDGFPYFIKKGDKFYDGYVLSIKDNEIVLRQKLIRPLGGKKYKDIVKKLKLGEEG
ncbi:MAG: hypothetical protein ACE5WD_04340 [Candidatus Aminicenantia bacterium]